MSSFVSGTYASYKAGTAKILDWLYENAEKCGYGEIDSEEEDEGTEGSKKKKKKLVLQKPKPKGKKDQRSKAKGSRKAKSKRPIANTTIRQVITKEFPTLAEAIASSKPKILVPTWLISMLRDLIKLRKTSAGWLSRRAGGTTTNGQSNQTHVHFIGILENVLQILSRCGTPGRSFDNKSDAYDPLDKITNIFEALDMEADTEHTMTLPTGPDSKPKLEVILDEEALSEETLWPVYCFFEDFNIAREHLKNLWTAYKKKDNKMDLTAVALATNTTLELLQRAEVELLKDLTKLTKELSHHICVWKNPKSTYLCTAFSSLQLPHNEFGGSEDTKRVLMGGISFMKRDQPQKKHKGIAKKLTITHRLSTIQTLEALEECITGEFVAMNLDYFALQICITLLRNLTKELDSTFIKYIGPGYMEKESEMAFNIGYIFMILAVTEKQAENLPRRLREYRVSTDVLDRAGKVMQTTIEKEGDSEITKIMKACKTFQGLEMIEVRD